MMVNSKNRTQEKFDCSTVISAKDMMISSARLCFASGTHEITLTCNCDDGDSPGAPG